MTQAVVCLAPSGAGMTYYRRWPAEIGGQRVLRISLPGRDDRFRERPVQTMTEAVESLAARLPAAPVVLYGHSLGAAVAFELARRPEVRAAALVVSGRQPPDRPSAALTRAPSTAAELRALMLRLGAVPPAERSAAGLAQVTEAFYADLQVSLGYRWAGDDPLSIPITAVGFADDRVTPALGLGGWSRATTGRFVHRVLPGDHAEPFIAPQALLREL